MYTVNIYLSRICVTRVCLYEQKQMRTIICKTRIILIGLYAACPPHIPEALSLPPNLPTVLQSMVKKL
jgi:hypothetical protein